MVRFPLLPIRTYWLINSLKIIYIYNYTLSLICKQLYFQLSEICLSAVHMGVLGPDGGLVTFKKHIVDKPEVYIGSLRNRIISKTPT